MNTELRIVKKFRQGCADYALLEDGDAILIALSGGKDSLMLTRLLAAQAKIHKPSIRVEAAHVVMDNIPYEADNSYLEHYCQNLGMPLHIIHSSFDETTDTRKTKCFLCAWNRRKALFTYAAEHGFNKIALGHHQDDIIVTWLMNITFEGSNFGMAPKVVMRNFPLQLIRPLCLVHEDWIAEVAEEQGFAHLKRLCPYETTTRRTDMTRIFHDMQRLNPEARYSLWTAMQNKSAEA